MVDLASELGFDPSQLSGGAHTRGHQLRMASLKRDERLRAEMTGEPAALEEPIVVMNQASGAPMAMLAGMIPGGFVPRPEDTGTANDPNQPYEPLHTSVGALQQRVAIYVARDNKLTVAVESAPEWDTIKQWKLDEVTTVALLPILRCLGVKIKDTTGDLDDLERRYELGQRNQETDSWPVSHAAVTSHPPADQQAGSGTKAAPRRRNASKRSDPAG